MTENKRSRRSYHSIKFHIRNGGMYFESDTDPQTTHLIQSSTSWAQIILSVRGRWTEACNVTLALVYWQHFEDNLFIWMLFYVIHASACCEDLAVVLLLLRQQNVDRCSSNSSKRLNREKSWREFFLYRYRAHIQNIRRDERLKFIDK